MFFHLKITDFQKIFLFIRGPGARGCPAGGGAPVFQGRGLGENPGELGESLRMTHT